MPPNSRSRRPLPRPPFCALLSRRKKPSRPLRGRFSFFALGWRPANPAPNALHPRCWRALAQPAPVTRALTFHLTPLQCGTTSFANASAHVPFGALSGAPCHSPVCAPRLVPLRLGRCLLRVWAVRKNTPLGWRVFAVACVFPPTRKKGAAIVKGSRPLACAGVSFSPPPRPASRRGAQLKRCALQSASAFNNPKSVKKC